MEFLEIQNRPYLFPAANVDCHGDRLGLLANATDGSDQYSYF